MIPTWSLSRIAAPLSPLEAIAGDVRMLDIVARGDAPALARLWRCNSCLAVPNRVAQSAEFPAAVSSLAEMGWPVVIRATGGTPVPLTPGMLNLSLAYCVPAAWNWSIDDAYRHLAGLLQQALYGIGVTAEIGEIAGAICPGRFDLAIGGRKIAGAAQRRRSLPGQNSTAILAHAVIFVTGDHRMPFAALRAFEDRLRNPVDWQAEQMTCLQDHGAGIDVASMTGSLVTVLAQSPPPHAWALASARSPVLHALRQQSPRVAEDGIRIGRCDAGNLL